MDGTQYLVSRLQRLTAVLMLAGLLVVSSCALLFPAKPIEQSWADGTYRNACCAPLTLRNGIVFSEGQRSAYRIEFGKNSYLLNVPEGISVEAGHVVFGGNANYMEFNDSSGLHRTEYHAKTLAIYSRDGGDHVLFLRQ